jgi:hypothetical protein
MEEARPKRNTTWQEQFALFRPKTGNQLPAAQANLEPGAPASGRGILEDYVPFMEVELAGTTVLAAKKTGELVAIKKFTGYDEEVIRVLVNVPHPNIIRSLGSRTLSSEIHLFQEVIDTTLRQVLAVPKRFSENQIATVCTAVSKMSKTLPDFGLNKNRSSVGSDFYMTSI